MILDEVCCVYLDNNFIPDAFFPETRNDPAYEELRPRFYEALYQIAKENLLVKNTVLLDAPHIVQMKDEQWAAFIRQLAKDTSARLVVIHCTCSAGQLKQRLARRGLERDKWKLENWEAFIRRERPDVSIPFEHLRVNTETPLDATHLVSYILDCRVGVVE
jgi:predicted kinase